MNSPVGHKRKKEQGGTPPSQPAKKKRSAPNPMHRSAHVLSLDQARSLAKRFRSGKSSKGRIYLDGHKVTADGCGCNEQARCKIIIAETKKWLVPTGDEPDEHLFQQIVPLIRDDWKRDDFVKNVVKAVETETVLAVAKLDSRVEKILKNYSHYNAKATVDFKKRFDGQMKQIESYLNEFGINVDNHEKRIAALEAQIKQQGSEIANLRKQLYNLQIENQHQRTAVGTLQTKTQQLVATTQQQGGDIAKLCREKQRAEIFKLRKQIDGRNIESQHRDAVIGGALQAETQQLAAATRQLARWRHCLKVADAISELNRFRHLNHSSVL